LCLSSMTNITINTHISCSVTIHTPTHCLAYFAANPMHLSHLAVASCAFNSGFDVRLVRVVGVRLRFYPVAALPPRLLLPLRVSPVVLKLRAFCLSRLVAAHTRGYVLNCGVRRLIYVFVAEGALQLRSFIAFLGHVLPVIKFDRLPRPFRFPRSAQQQYAYDRDRQNHKH